MYRLCKFFISDVTAGKNLLRNGCIPIVRDNGRADHGVLFAANGTCKTTVLSFVLSVFSPHERRFVQHLQSGGDKTLDQYLIPGRPAAVLVDVACVQQPTLFEAEPEEHLVLGQLLYRHRSAKDKVDRIFFIAQSVAFFEQLRAGWDALLDQEQPWRAVRDFASPHVQQTHNQKEWSDSLERLGLDPWLIDRQIDFARSEGGIKDAFKFRSEDEFLNFFLGCVTDMDAAADLRENIGRSLRKMEDRPRKIAQLRAARDLKERMADFDGLARKWRDAQSAVESFQAVLGEAAHLIQQANQGAEKETKLLAPSLQKAENQRREALTQTAVARANVAVVRRYQLQGQLDQAEKEIARTEREIQSFRMEENALKSADIIAQLRRNRAQVQIKQDALLQADAALSPLLRRVDDMALQYHARLDSDRQGIMDDIAQWQERIADLQSAVKTSEARRADLEAQREALGEKMGANTTRIQAAEQNREALPLAPGETPENAHDRLQGQIHRIEERITAEQGRLADFDEKMRNAVTQWRALQKKRSETEIFRDQARQRVDAEARQRERLLASAHLQRVAGTPDFEPTSAALLSRLDDAITRARERLAEKERRRLNVEMELEQLSGIQTLAGDAQTRKLIAHYHAQGISPGELKAFPDYLAGLYEQPGQVATFVESDPGRFTGIMAASAGVVDTVMQLPVPHWLHRPVVISTPCPPDALTTIAQAVIRPQDPKVYAESYLEETRNRLKAQLAAMEQEVGVSAADLREMAADSRDLHAYREMFADATVVSALSDRLAELDRTLAGLTSEIADAEILSDTLGQRKTEVQNTIQDLTIDAARLTEQLRQVDGWLDRYRDLDTWKGEGEAMIAAKTALTTQIGGEAKVLLHHQEEITVLVGDIRHSRYLLTGLDERAGDVPKPQEAVLSEEQNQAALTMDLTTLRELFSEARRSQRRKADELGVDALQTELEVVQNAIADHEARLQTLRREYPHDFAQADRWAAGKSSEREQRRVWLAGEIEKRSGTLGGLRSDMTYQNREIDQLGEALAEHGRNNIHPDVSESDLADQDPDGLIHRLQSEAGRHEQTTERLSQRCRELRASLDHHNNWCQQIQIGLAETEDYAPLWDGDSPRSAWPDLLGASSAAEKIEAVKALRDQVRVSKTAREKEHTVMDAARRRMSNGFDRLQADLQSDRFRNHLPAVVDELRRYDTEALGTQAEELIQRCDQIASNIESDLEISQRIVENLVDMLLSRAKEYHQKLQTAAQQKLPKDIFIYGGESILRAGTRLDFTRYGNDFKRSVENWLHELIQKDRLPEVNPRAGNCLGGELLYQLLAASTGKKSFGIRLLKCDDTGHNYEPVGKDLGSGGEALTTAVLLYTLLISMRKKRHNHPDGRIPAFLVLDNPLGVCNRSDFLDVQLKVARAMGIQCVYLTGINDRESLGLFELRVAIRKGDKKLEIDRVAYDLLEVNELNVERTDGPPLA
ncbi:MAG: hypothetical protein HKP58_19700 [Desulfatitalea sp.]|nr:hypothetical protein [Desulfatitalea sp.]NNK02642.1 hypothetical protein [Desulfatitalea sp.]